ncbi:MAG TPA: glycosyltransferase [Pseudobdellovibrionaceae bacterium]|nr:glycosyltransferase [Pseudobdellovibrionaceae bacterium]
MKNFDVVISIVIYQQKIQDLDLLLSDLGKIKDLSLQIVIVDNSTESQILSKDFLEKKEFSEKIDSIFSGKNLGYGRAHNLAIQKYNNHCRYHLVLNPDIRITEGTLESLIQAMDQNPNLGLSIPPTIYEDGSPQYLVRLLPTPMDLIVRLLPFPQFVKNHFNDQYEMKEADYNQKFEAPYLSGCFMLLRSTVVKALIQEMSPKFPAELRGPFDDRFFMYFEDVDLSRRVFSKASCQYLPLGKITHGYQRGSRKSFALLRAHLFSAFQYFSKWGWFFDPERTRINREKDPS